MNIEVRHEMRSCAHTLEEILDAKRIIAEVEAIELYSRLNRVRPESETRPTGKLYRQHVLANAILKCTSSTVGRWRDKEGLPHSKASRSVFDVVAAWRWFEQHKPRRVKAMDADHLVYVRRLLEDK